MFHLGVLQNFLLYEQHSDTYDPPWCVTKPFLLYVQHGDTYDPPWCVINHFVVRAT